MTENIETPDGWERMGHRFVRAYGHKLAVMANDSSDGTWLPWIHESVNSVYQGTWKPLPEAVAWANGKLGVPKPVEVVEERFDDFSIIVKDAKSIRVAMVVQLYGRFCVIRFERQDYFGTEAEALDAARAYVRGDA